MAKGWTIIRNDELLNPNKKTREEKLRKNFNFQSKIRNTQTLSMTTIVEESKKNAEIIKNRENQLLAAEKEGKIKSSRLLEEIKEIKTKRESVKNKKNVEE